MLHLLTPNYVYNSIYDITPEFLLKKGIHGVMIDIDGTMSSHRIALPSQKLQNYVMSLVKAGIAVIFLSNNNAQRVGAFSDPMKIKWISRAHKPRGRGFREGADMLGLPMNQIAVIGDQIFTDVLGGNRAGALTLQVQSIDRDEFWIKVRCGIEKGFIERGRRKMREEDTGVH